MDERIYGLLGRKLGHSWSVPIHAALGCGATASSSWSRRTGPFLHRKDIGGLNVTIPYKRDVMPLCDEIDPAAEAIGSVNTIVRRPTASWWASIPTSTAFAIWPAGRASPFRKKGRDFGQRRGVSDGPGRRPAGGRPRSVVISRSGPDNYDNLSATPTRTSW